MLNKLKLGAAIVSALFLLSACVATKKNHQARLLLKNADSLNGSSYQYPELPIQKGDLLTIMVFSDNVEATKIYNQPQTLGSTGSGAASSGGSLSSSGTGYLVGIDGKIYVHQLGLINAAGLTKTQLATEITEGLKTYIKNPYITIRYTNARVTVLGDVAKPGVIEMPDQKMSVLDAIGLAGDLTPFGRRDQVIVIREVDGKRTVGKIDVGQSNAYKSPFFYLQQNDLVYIEPTRKKPTGNEQVLMRNIAIGTSLLSIVTLLITLATR